MIASGDAAGGESRDYARIIVESAQRMTRIIRQLLDFARRRGPRKETCDVGLLASRATQLLQPIAERNHVTTAVTIAAPAPAASVDAAQVEQAVTNLVVNAIQASQDGAAVDIEVEGCHAQPPADVGGPPGEWLAVRVRDHGSGIAPEVLPHIFEPFYTTKDVGNGTGLGLSVAYGIARDHGGWISVESGLGRGTVFTLYLPREGTA
jgi:signal transduction histidine kinase